MQRPDKSTCRACHGSGRVPVRKKKPGRGQKLVPCPKCGGSGKGYGTK